MAELFYASTRDLARMLRRREVSSRELLELFLARIERHNPALNAVVTLDAERARADALAKDEALAHGQWQGPLHGVPMTIKDSFEVAAVRTTSGAKRWSQHVPASDALAVQRLRAAGAIVMGKTNVPAFCADVQTFNATFGTTNNPWDLARTPGGSSGGAAAALAAGLTPLELGSDIGGSIRTPASWSGVCGHKPTYGLIPQRGHMPSPPGALAAVDLNVIGPLARTPDDLALSLGVLAGPAPEEAKAYSLHLPPPRAASLRGYRIACWFDDPVCPVASDVRARLEQTAARLRQCGAQLVDAKPEFELARLIDIYRRLLDPVLSSDLPASVIEALRRVAGSEAPDSDPMARHARNALRPHREWLEVDELRQQLRAACARFFDDYDVLLCPATPITAPLHDHSQPMLLRTLHIDGRERPYADLFVWIALATTCSLPATVVPVGSSQGLPVGLQIIGPSFEDHTTLDVAGRIYELLGGFAEPPGYSTGSLLTH